MVAILEMSDAVKGFKQIIDFLSGSYINHALTMNPHFYISCIKQFWKTAVVKRSGNVTRLQALVDKKRIVITEKVVHEILQLNDAEGQRFNFSKYIFESLVHDVDSSSKFYMVGKGFSGVETPLFENMLEVRDVAEEAEAQVPAQGDDVQEHAAEEVVANVIPPTPTSPSPLSPQVLDTCSALAHRVEGLEHDKAAQQLEIVKLKARVKKLERFNKVKSSKLRRLKKDEGIELVADQEKNAEKDAEVEGRHADKQVEIYNIDLDHSSKVLSMQEDDTEVAAVSTPIPAAKLKTLTITAAPAVSTRKRKGVVIRDHEEELYSDTPAETPKNAALDNVQSKEPQYIKRYHGMKKKPQTESEACKNMILYLRNTEGYKMKFFKGLKYDEILPIFQAKFDANMRFLFKKSEEMEAEDEEIIKSINETPAQKAAKKRKLHEQAKEDEDLKKQLETMFEKTDGQDAIWRNQQSVYGQALVKSWKLLTSCGVHIISLTTTTFILLVKKRYPLSKFTLEQLVNVVRLKVEEESEMSLELLRFTRQQLQEYQQG
nr:hypothetical protein [Tanacetum cinerariifolium]